MSNILCVSVFDNGQQLQCIAEALRNYTNNDAIHLNIKQSYLDYDADVKLSEIGGYKKTIEFANHIADCDFFIFSEVFPVDVKDVLERLHVYHKINQSNTIIRVGGTHVRPQIDKYLLAWLRDGWVLAGLHHDWSLIGGIGRIFPLPSICPIDKIPEPIDTGNSVGIAFSPTKKKKGTNGFVRVSELIKAGYENVFSYPIIGQSWKESVSIKSGCRITFDQFMLNMHANSSIEGMYLKHAVLSNIGNYARFCYPDLPIISTGNEKELYTELKNLLDQPKLIDGIGNRGKEFVLKHHAPAVVAEKLNYLIEHIEEL